MISPRTGIRPDEVRFGGQHVLFVEGKDRNAIDPNVLRHLLDPGIRVEPLGPSYSVKSVAEALYVYHPNYYFLVDRDHHDEAFIERCWRNFPDPDTHNLLVWRRREIENYFLEPGYLSRSRFCRVERDTLKEQVLRVANDRLFLDAANCAIISIREELKRKWIEIFSNPQEFQDAEMALSRLQAAREFEDHRNKVARTVSADEVARRFRECLERMTGDQSTLDFGAGQWVSLIQGKKILSQLINSTSFHVQTADGTVVTDIKEKINDVAKDLLQQDDDVQPQDFIDLRQLIHERITS